MGFVVNPIDFTIISPLIMKRDFEVADVTKSIPPNTTLTTTDTLMFFDIEPTDIIGIRSDQNLYVPHIKELSMFTISIQDFNRATDENIISKCTIHTVKNITNHQKLINTFLKIYRECNSPVLLAHNGHRFDFLILQAYIKRYTTFEVTFRYYDTLQAVYQSNLRISSRTNSSLFKRLINSTDDNLVRIHTAEADVHLLVRWFRNFTMSHR